MSDRFDALMALDPLEATPADVPVDRLEAGLQCEDNIVRTQAANLLKVRSLEEPESLEPLVPVLVDRLDDERYVVVRESIATLRDVAEADADALEGHLQPVLDLLTADRDEIRVLASRVVAQIAVANPDRIGGHVDRLLDALELEVESPVEVRPDDAPGVGPAQRIDRGIRRESEMRQYGARLLAAKTLITIALEDASHLVPHASRLVDLLDTDSGAVQTAAVIAVSELAERDPDLVEAGVDPLCEALSVRDETTASRAVTALGFIGDERAVAPLRSLAADEDRDDDLRDLARETADWLEP